MNLDRVRKSKRKVRVAKARGALTPHEKQARKRINHQCIKEDKDWFKEIFGLDWDYTKVKMLVDINVNSPKRCCTVYMDKTIQYVDLPPLSEALLAVLNLEQRQTTPLIRRLTLLMPQLLKCRSIHLELVNGSHNTDAERIEEVYANVLTTVEQRNYPKPVICEEPPKTLESGLYATKCGNGSFSALRSRPTVDAVVVSRVNSFPLKLSSLLEKLFIEYPILPVLRLFCPETES